MLSSLQLCRIGCEYRPGLLFPVDGHTELRQYQINGIGNGNGRATGEQQSHRLTVVCFIPSLTISDYEGTGIPRSTKRTRGDDDLVHKSRHARVIANIHSGIVRKDLPFGQKCGPSILLDLQVERRSDGSRLWRTVAVSRCGVAKIASRR